MKIKTYQDSKTYLYWLVDPAIVEVVRGFGTVASLSDSEFDTPLADAAVSAVTDACAGSAISSSTW